jgi:hypothetical protein
VLERADEKSTGYAASGEEAFGKPRSAAQRPKAVPKTLSRGAVKPHILQRKFLGNWMSRNHMIRNQALQNSLIVAPIEYHII